MALTIVTPPAVEPVSLADVKAHCRIDGTVDDPLILSFIEAARNRIDGAEGFLGRALITQTWDLWCDAWPSCGFELPLAPVQHVTHVKYTDTDGDEQTLDPAAYIADLKSAPARIVPAIGASWPAAQVSSNAVTVRFVAGYGDGPGAVPAMIRHHLRLLVAHWYDNRGFSGSEVPPEIDALVVNYRLWWA